MLGKIYIITNDINNKVYIGQTIRSLKQRFNDHIYDAINIDGHINKFHIALLTIGINHFKINTLEEVDSNMLDAKEVEYIKKYDSYYNGYNSTLGGSGKAKVEYIEDDIVNSYNEGKSIRNIANEMGIVNTKVISHILNKNNIQIRNTCKQIYSVDKHKNITKYQSITDAYFSVVKEIGEIKFTNFSYLINKSNKYGTIAYKHIWTFDYDNVENIINELNKKDAVRDEKNTQLFCCKCNKPITKKSKSGMCSACANARTNCGDKPDKPNREELLVLISHGIPLNEIARIYQRSPGTVHYWLKSYGIR